MWPFQRLGVWLQYTCGYDDALQLDVWKLMGNDSDFEYLLDSLHVSALEVVHWSWHSLCFAACLVWWRYTLFFPSLSETKPFGLSFWMKLFFELEETLWSWPCEPESVHIWVAEESLLTGLLQLPAVCLNHNLVLIFLSSFSVHTYTDPPPVQINTLSKSTHTVLSIN